MFPKKLNRDSSPNPKEAWVSTFAYKGETEAQRIREVAFS